MKVFGYTVINSDGWIMGNESKVNVFLDQNKCIHNAYEEYLKLHEANVCELDNGYKMIESFDEFKASFLNVTFQAAGILQFSDYHIQFEYFETEVN